MFALPTPPLWPGFSAVFFSAVLGASSSEASQTPLGLTIRLANSQLQEREPHARAPGGPSSRPGRTRPGSLPAPGLAPGRENWQAGAALPGGGVGNRGGYDAPAAATPCPDQVRQRGRGAQQGWGASPLGKTLGGSRGPEARPAHRTRSGPRPGAFRACAAACLGKSRPSSRRHGPARQSGGGDSRNLPGDRWRVTRHYEPRYGQCFRCVSGESPGARGWAGLRLRTVRFSPKRRHGPWW